jgi:hypothetical protein
MVVGGDHYEENLHYIGSLWPFSDGSAGIGLHRFGVAGRRAGAGGQQRGLVQSTRENKLVNVALHHTGELDYLQHIPYSLRFE